jgi:hypothetical protein
VIPMTKQRSKEIAEAALKESDTFRMEGFLKGAQWADSTNPRVKRLTEALESLMSGHEMQFKDSIEDKNPYFICKRALEDES